MGAIIVQILILCAGIAWEAGEAPPPVPVVTSLPAYRLGPGDVIDIKVIGHEEWSMQVEVRPDGRITYPATGEINVAGLTIQQLTKGLTLALGPVGHHLKNPKVIINVIKKRALMAYVLGAVANPGVVQLPLGFETAKKILSMVGGAAPDADLTRVVIYNQQQKSKEINLQAQLEGKEPDTVIYAGEVMVVPRVKPVIVGVLGEVGKTGYMALPPGKTEIDILSLVLQAGGIGPNADRKRALILRADGKIEEIPLEEVLLEKEKAPILKDGDVLWVLSKPEQQFFQIIGAVGTPGRYPCRKGTTLGEAIALAGQLLEQADAGHVVIIHSNGERENVDLRPLLAGKNVEVAQKPVSPDDLILVPRQEKSYVVLGAVHKPGIFQWSENTKLADALARAGGPIERGAALSNVILVRRTGGNQPIVMENHAEELIAGTNEAANLVLLPNDTIYVPTREERTWREKLDLPLFLLSIASNIRYLTE
ncbi:MAG: SLBB domain-containing protein [Armatimonadetes bacterium]|nr:SLBB domain-containing protein [Armatimonadota bacterium]